MNNNDKIITAMCILNILVLLYFVSLLVIPKITSQMVERRREKRLSSFQPSAKVVEIAPIVKQRSGRGRTKIIRLGMDDEGKKA